MTHVFFEGEDTRATMVCGADIAFEEDGAPMPPISDFVGIGSGVIRDGTMYSSVQQLAMVDCAGCLDCFAGIHRRTSAGKS